MKTQPTWRVVHILDQGLALCGAGMPNSWPTAHRWVPLKEYPTEIGKHSFCQDCQDEYQKTHAAAMTTVSLEWVLNQLAGMKFPEQGQAYDFIKKAAKRALAEAIEVAQTLSRAKEGCDHDPVSNQY